MTAIAGIIGFKDFRPARACVRRLEVSLSQFGEDAQNSVMTGSSALVRTLFRTTPEDFFDTQPLVHELSGIQLVFDGRIDNREEFAKKLDLKGSELVQMADSELVLLGVLRWDTKVCNLIVGDFAIAVWRSRERQLWLARDPLGIRPLFWHVGSKFAAFASQASAIFSIGGIEKVLDQETLHDTIALIPNKSDRSFFRGISRVKPGHIVVISPEGNVKHNRFHSFLPRKTIRYAHDTDYVEAFTEHLKCAVDARLRSHHTVASHLSSGRDSTLVTVMAASLLQAENKSLCCVTAGLREGFLGKAPRGRHLDETINACLVASHYPNIIHSIYRHQSQSHIDGLQAMIEATDRPPLNLDNLGWTNGLQERIRQLGAHVVLTGWFGNFGASYDGFERLPHCFATGRWASLFAELMAFRRRYPKTYRGWFLRATLGPFMTQGLWKRWSNRYGGDWTDLTSYAALNPKQMAEMQTLERAKHVNHDLAYRPSRSTAQHRIKGLELVDPGEYALWDDVCKVQSRHPLGDLRLLQYTLSIPDDQFLKQADHGRLANRFLRNRVPPAFFSTRTKGQQAGDWYETLAKGRKELSQEISRLIQNQSASDLLDLEFMSEAIESHTINPADFQSIKSHRLKLLRGLSVGCFIVHHTDAN